MSDVTPELGTKARMTGWWSVASTSQMRPEHYDQVRDLLQSAHERGEEVVAVDGITFTRHPVEEVTEDRIRAEARAAVLAEIDGFTFPWADYIEPGVDDALLELAAYLRRDTLSDGGPTDG